jgi:GNAT superfamily N-acetyltransferase
MTEPLDDRQLLEQFDRQVRRAAGAAPPGFRYDQVQDPAPMTMLTPIGDVSWGGGVFWCDLDESNADAAIAAAIEHFRPSGRDFEWKHYGYDRPADLADRLAAAGLRAEGEETLVVGEVAVVRDRLAAAGDPTGITVRRLSEDDKARALDWQRINVLHSTVWEEDSSDQIQAVAAEHLADPAGMSVWLAESGDGTVVCAAWVRFHQGTDFASLWGGSTLEAYRGRGIYKALVARRAAEAAERGYRFLQVDASPDSRPILERLGLRTLTSTTPFVWEAAAALAGRVPVEG